jgi:hypothetical protein
MKFAAKRIRKNDHNKKYFNITRSLRKKSKKGHEGTEIYCLYDRAIYMVGAEKPEKIFAFVS